MPGAEVWSAVGCSSSRAVIRVPRAVSVRSSMARSAPANRSSNRSSAARRSVVRSPPQAGERPASPAAPRPPPWPSDRARPGCSPAPSRSWPRSARSPAMPEPLQVALLWCCPCRHGRWTPGRGGDGVDAAVTLHRRRLREGLPGPRPACRLHRSATAASKSSTGPPNVWLRASDS